MVKKTQERFESERRYTLDEELLSDPSAGVRDGADQSGTTASGRISCRGEPHSKGSRAVPASALGRGALQAAEIGNGLAERVWRK